MSPIASSLVVALFVALLATLAFLLAYRRRLHRLLGRDVGDPIPTVGLDRIDAAFTPDELGPTPDAEAVVIGADGVPGGTSDREAWILAVLARRARLLFEFGTATGRTAYLWARNAPRDARIVTLTLPPDQRGEYRSEPRDSRRAARHALQESVFTRFRYTGTSVEAKVVQLYGDSKELDVSRYRGRCDVVFVDGSHARSYVESDSELALQMVAPGGIVVWHDYRGRNAATGDVYRVLNRLAARLPLVRIRGTSLVAYRAHAE